MEQPKVTPQAVADHGLSEQEYQKIIEILGREPNFTELGVFSVMWSEHCSYKNSIALLKTLPRDGEALLSKAGEENAGVVDIGGGLAVVFKIESHNHPSAVEPYQGAATGVGGILRDIFTMGARPIASLNSLRFGLPENPRVRYLVDGVVRGIGDYGNSFGVPTVAGETYFDDAYTGNPLINAMAVGIAKADGLVSGKIAGIGNAVMIVGSKTGRDGIHGATFASEELSEKSEEKRPSVQIGDPFTEKLLLEATLEIIREDLVIGVQDMGAAGITCSCSEMSFRGGAGVTIDIDRVPIRESEMTPYEILLSESQERMLVCVKKGREEDVRRIFEKWELNSTIIGESNDSGIFKVRLDGETVVDIPSDALALGGRTPVYHRETKKPAYIDKLSKIDLKDYAVNRDFNRDLLTMLAAPNICDKSWVYNQYDSMVRTNTAVGPGSDAAVIRVRKTSKALAFATDCNGRYCYLNPRQGAMLAVSEAARNIVCSGGRPVAITNCLNFGNPYKPEIYYGFAEAVAGMGDACRVFGTPVTGGNVSFYNEDPDRAVFPTPTVGMLGIIENVSQITTQWFKEDGDFIYLIGETKEELGASEYLHTIFGKNIGPVPDLDLDFEKRMQDTLLEAIQAGLIKSAHDCSDGGLAVALAECCISNREHLIGGTVHIDDNIRPDCLLFGETQSRAVVTVAESDAESLVELCARNDIPVSAIGTVGGDRLKINDLTDVSLGQMEKAYYESLPAILERVTR
ncbi:MAG: phosphoribosylformylglycinamidine synthase subunit PurL [Candidatus Zixiibacteriota bacterium]|nr:MAG: phosphoribosylformylglycinamidine synthase subunit PurL [candidate division Zixibacteria bacterium]